MYGETLSIKILFLSNWNVRCIVSESIEFILIFIVPYHFESHAQGRITFDATNHK